MKTKIITIIAQQMYRLQNRDISISSQCKQSRLICIFSFIYSNWKSASGDCTSLFFVNKHLRICCNEIVVMSLILNNVAWLSNVGLANFDLHFKLLTRVFLLTKRRNEWNSRGWIFFNTKFYFSEFISINLFGTRPLCVSKIIAISLVKLHTVPLTTCVRPTVFLSRSLI